MKRIIAICSLVIATSFSAKAQTKAWTYTWTNSGVDFTTAGVICFPSTNGVTAAIATDGNTNSSVLWLKPSGTLIRQIKFTDMNPTGFLYASTNKLVMTGYNLDYTKSLFRTFNSNGTNSTISSDGYYPQPDHVPISWCNSNQPVCFSDPRQVANYIAQSGFTIWTITSSNSAIITHYTLP